MSKIVLYKDLIVWKKAVDLSEQVYLECKNFPKGEYSFKDQIVRCSLSVPSNIAEGKGRSGYKDLLKFLIIARGSLYELQTQLLIAHRVNLIETQNHSGLFKLSEEVVKLLNAFIGKVNRDNS